MPGNRLTLPLAANVGTKHRRVILRRWFETVCLVCGPALRTSMRSEPYLSCKGAVAIPCGSQRLDFSVLTLSYHRDIALTSPLPKISQTLTCRKDSPY